VENVHVQTSFNDIHVVRVDRSLPEPGYTFAGDSRYVEVVYVGVLGPSATVIYRHLYWTAHPAGSPVEIDVAELARATGVKTAIARRSIRRLVDFRFAQMHGHELVLRSRIPAVSERLLCRLSPPVVAFHHASIREIGRAS